jgi:hypothetical protein
VRRQTGVMLDDGFAEAAQESLRRVPTEPCRLGAGRWIVPRDVLRDLAAMAADWPHTPPEIWYGEIMQECFWALVSGQPPPIPGEDDRSAAEGLAFGVLLALMSMDRGGHHAAADLCETALAYMASLPAWRDVRIEIDPSEGRTGLIIETTVHDAVTGDQPDQPKITE